MLANLASAGSVAVRFIAPYFQEPARGLKVSEKFKHLP